MVNTITQKKINQRKACSLIMAFMLSLLLTFNLTLPKLMSSNKVYADYNVSMGSDGKVTTTGDLAPTDGATSWNNIIGKLQFFVAGVTGVGTVAMVLFFVYNFVKLGSTSDNDSARAKVIKGLVWSAIAAAGLGAVTIFVGFFLNSMV